MVVLIGGEKGGTGKTTLATNLAAMRAADGKDVLLVDTDRQGSASAWAAIRSQGDGVQRVACIQKFGTAVTAELQDLRSRYGDIIIDVGGRDSVELRAAMLVADKLFIPIQASQFDVWTLGQMEEVVAQARAFNPGLQTYVLINRASTHPSVNEASDARELLEDFSFRAADTVLHDRIAYRKAAKIGLSVSELSPADAKASAEIQMIYKDVFDE